MSRKLFSKKNLLSATSLLLIVSLSLPALANDYSRGASTSQQITSRIDSSETITVGGKRVDVSTFSTKEAYKNVKKVIDKDTVNRLNALNIEYYIENDTIKLENPTRENIAKYNNNAITRATTYPTAWTNMPASNAVLSKKFQKATKTAFATAVGTWLKSKTSSWEALASAATIAFGTYYFLNSDVADVYTYITYSYRALSAGKFDSMGNFIGDYEIKKSERTTLSTTDTGGQLTTTIKKSSIVDPWF